MVQSYSDSLASFPLPACTFLCALLVCGCGDSRGVGKLYPVTGEITLNGEPLKVTTTMVLFRPDASRGNGSRVEPAGTVDADGDYTVFTEGKEGAPLGWYKVIVTATSTEVQTTHGKRDHPRPKSLLPASYGQAQTTDLAVEVVANPAPRLYDLKLTR